MKHLLRGFLLGIVIAVSAVAARIDVTEEENGKDLLLKRGDLLVVHLTANPSTGFGWKPALSKTGVLKPQGDVFHLANSPTNHLVGQGGTERWIFRAEKAGKVTLTLGYVRPWEKGKAPGKTVAWPVTVRP